MPVDHSGRFQVTGVYRGRTISCMTRSSYSRTRTSPRSNPVPYPTCEEIMVHMDMEGEEWYSSAGEDLYLKDFIFQARMQTARHATQRWERFPRRDRVLDCLIEEGTFDCQSLDAPDARKELAMSHSAAMVQRLLMRIECLEADVHQQTCSSRIWVDGSLRPDLIRFAQMLRSSTRYLQTIW